MATTNLGRVCLVPKGEYIAIVEYVFLDLVYYTDISYVSLKTQTGVTPTNDGVNWQQVYDIPATVTNRINSTYAEVVAARDGLANLLAKIDAIDAAISAAVSGAPSGSYANLAALIAANPDHSKIYITIDDGNWNYYNGAAFVAGGVYEDSAALAVTDAKIDLLNSYMGIETHAGHLGICMGLGNNLIASDVHNGTILGTGDTGYNNVIGGDGSATVGTTTPNEAETGTDARVSLIGGYDCVAGTISSKIIADHSYTERVPVDYEEGVDPAPGGGHCSIYGGSGHIARYTAGWSHIAGGNANKVAGVGDFATGYLEDVSGVCSSAMGSANVLTGDFSFAEGRQNEVSGNYAAAEGYLNEATNNYARARGLLCIAAGTYGSAEGYQAHSSRTGQRAYAVGKVAVNGDRQVSEMMAFKQTTDATPISLSNETAQLYLVKENQSAAFSALIIARDEAGTDSAGFKVEGVVYRGTGHSYVIGTPTVTALGASAGASTWAIDSVVGNSTGYLVFMVAGEADTTIDWVLKLSLAEVLVPAV